VDHAARPSPPVTKLRDGTRAEMTFNMAHWRYSNADQS